MLDYVGSTVHGVHKLTSKPSPDRLILYLPGWLLCTSFTVAGHISLVTRSISSVLGCIPSTIMMKFLRSIGCEYGSRGNNALTNLISQQYCIIICCIYALIPLTSNQTYLLSGVVNMCQG